MLNLKIISMDILDNLQKRNKILKSKLLHEKLQHGNYEFIKMESDMIKLLNEYSSNKSLIKSSLRLGIGPNQAISWYIQGQNGNPQFEFFYLRINQINNPHHVKMQESTFESENVSKKYSLSKYGENWVYITFVDTKKVSMISGDLKRLKDKVKSKNLPID